MKVTPAGGAPIDLGETLQRPTIALTDHSRRETDDFGVTTIVERGFTRRMSIRLAVPFEQVDGLQRQLAGLRTATAMWVADESFAALRVEGLYKDFSIDLASPPISYCTLTVEGVVETAIPADPGTDPAVEGASTLQVLRPIEITDTMLSNSSVPENDHPTWGATITYAAGTKVMRPGLHRRFESLVAGNLGAVPETRPDLWLDLGPTNRWAMFDHAHGTVTSATGAIEVVLDAGTARAVALIDVNAASVRVRKGSYDQTRAVGTTPLTFLDLPAGGGLVTVTIVGPGAVSAGTLLIGTLFGLGTTEASPTAGISDFSRRETDEFGGVTVVQRGWAKRMTAGALIRSDAVDVVINRFAGVRAQPCLWIGDAGSEALTVYGIFKDVSVEVDHSVSTLSLSVEGFTDSVKAKPLGSLIAWPDIAAPDPARPKPEDGATVGAPDGTPIGGTRQPDGSVVGGRPAEQVVQRLDQVIQDAAALVETFGETEAAGLARDAAEAARDIAIATAERVELDEVSAHRAALAALPQSFDPRWWHDDVVYAFDPRVQPDATQLTAQPDGYELAGSTSVSSKFLIPTIPANTIELVLEYTPIQATATNVARVFVNWRNAAGIYIGGQATLVPDFSAGSRFTGELVVPADSVTANVTVLPDIRAGSNDRVLLRALSSTDVTVRKITAGHVAAAAQSSQSATTKADEAGQSATAAQAAQTGAETANGEAGTARNEAVAASQDAVGAATTATQQASVSVAARQGSEAARDHTEGLTTAAAGHAQTASAKAGEARQDATAAQAAVVQTGADRADAKAFRDQAAASAQGADGANSSARQEAGLAAGARDRAENAARATAADVVTVNAKVDEAGQFASSAQSSARLSASIMGKSLPADFVDRGRYWSGAFTGVFSDAVQARDAQPDGAFGDTPEGRAWDSGTSPLLHGSAGNSFLFSKGTLPLVLGRTYRLTLRARQGGEASYVRPYFNFLDANGINTGYAQWHQRPQVASEGWVTRVLTYRHGIDPANGGAAGSLVHAGLDVARGANLNTQVVLLRLEDITDVAGVEASLDITRQVVAQVDGRTQAHLAIAGRAGNGGFLIEARARDANGVSSSDINLIASRVSLKNVVGGAVVDALRTEGGNVFMPGNLAAGAMAVYANGVQFRVALSPTQLLISDGVAVTLPNTGSLWSIQPPAAAAVSLNPGEVFLPTFENQTNTGFMPRLRIVTPGTPTNRENLVDYAASSGPPRQIDVNAAEATDGNYTIRARGYLDAYHQGGGGEVQPRDPSLPPMIGDDPGGAGYYYGSADVAIWAMKGGAWQRIKAEPVSVYSEGGGGGVLRIEWFLDAAFGLGNGVQRVGLSIENVNAAAGEVTDITALQWQSQSAGGSRSATPNGEKISVLVRPS